MLFSALFYIKTNTVKNMHGKWFHANTRLKLFTCYVAGVEESNRYCAVSVLKIVNWPKVELS